MTTTHTRFLGILLLVLGMFVTPQVFAIEITDVVPASAPPDTSGLEVQIYGNDFNNKAEVTFHKPDGTAATDITVLSTTPKGSTKIIATIDIDAGAVEGDYTLRVSQQRRGGKGTTYEQANATFKVTGKPQDAVACGGDEGVFKEIDASDCNCKFVKKDEGGQGTPSAWIWVLQGSCETHTTLELPQYEVLNGNNHTLTAAEPFTGISVLTNAGHRTHVFSLNIQVESPDAGCDIKQPYSAISFVLDGTKEDPEESSDKDGRTYELTRLRAWGIKVDSAVPLCRAIEFRRETSYEALLEGLSKPAESYTDAVARVHDVWITSSSYSEAGIQVSGFVNSGQNGRSADKIGVDGNTVMGGDDAGGTAILFGPIDGPGTVSQNAISANGVSESGISVEGGVDSTDDVTIENNNVTGAYTGVLVDDRVDSAFFKSNILVGTGSGDGIDTSAFENRYRSNRIDGFDCEVREDGNCILP